MPTDAHHTRPESSYDPFEYGEARAFQALGGVLAVAADWLARHPDAAARFGRAAGDLVGAYRAARANQEYPF